jgi:nucleotide-binding universal stress UspA family protein
MAKKLRYHNILVPLDGSDLAECVLPHLEAIIIRGRAVNIRFIYVIDSLDVPFTKEEFKDKIESEARTSASHYLHEVVDRLGYDGSVTTEVVIGKTADAIMDYAAKHSIDLILMATHGRSGMSRWARGSVADKVIRASTTPVWLVRAGMQEEAFYEEWPKISIMVPLDGSEFGESVLPHAEAAAKQLSADLVDIVLVRVCELFTEPHYPPAMKMSWEEYQKYEEDRCKEICRKYLAGVEETMTARGFRVRTEVQVGDTAKTLIEYADNNAISLIVMSTHGRSGLSRLAFGSIAEKILHEVSRPVLLIRQPKAD